MSDLALRTAARHAALDGSPEARAALLRERLRAGAIAPERVALAAYCSDPAALLVVPRPLGAPSDCGLCHGHPDGILVVPLDERGDSVWAKQYREPCEHEIGAWLRGLARWGHEAFVRAAFAAARFWAAWGPEHHSRERDQRIVQSLEDFEEWEQTGHLTGDRPFTWPWHTPPRWEPVRQAWLMAHDGGTVERRADPAHAVSAVMAAAESCGEQPVRAAICSSLIAWALA